MGLTQELRSLVRGEVIDDEDSLRKYSMDASLFRVPPQAVIFPGDADDLKTLVRFIHEYPDEHLSLTARSAGTDMTGGPLNSSLILDFTRHFNHIKEVGEGFAVAEPGVFYRDFEKATLAKGYLLPSYPASREICALGGMVANNSGGEKTLAYGKTSRYVQALNVILSDGNEYLIKPLSQAGLMEKLALETWEGELYRRLYQLITSHKGVIEAARPVVSKNSAGYNLWDIWDGQTFDLTKLFVGSQGTLGLVTEITFKLIRPKAHSALLVIFLKDVTRLAELTQAILVHQPESFESFDDHTLKLGMQYLFFRFAFQFLPELGMVLTSGFPKLVLLAEFTADSQAEAQGKAERAQAALASFGLRTRVTHSARDAQKYWTVRRESFNLLRTKIKGKRTAPFIDDLTVRPEQLPEFLPQLEHILSQYDIMYTIAGHVGDGNFHIIPLMDLSQPDAPQIIRELMEKVYQLVFQFHGSMTAEHNDGLIRSPYLAQMFGEEMYELFKNVKQIFDPQNIFNPGKKIGASLDQTMKYLRRN